MPYLVHLLKATSLRLPMSLPQSSALAGAETRAEPVEVMPRDIAWSDAPRIIASGFAMGSADVVPGVSGGTMAVACGIYERLLGSIASINPRSIQALLTLRFREMLWIVHFRFLVSLLVGIFSAIVIMVKVIGLPQLLITHTALVYSVFFGLVFASVFILGKTITWNISRGAFLLLGTALGFFVVTRVP